MNISDRDRTEPFSDRDRAEPIFWEGDSDISSNILMSLLKQTSDTLKKFERTFQDIFQRKFSENVATVFLTK